MGSVLAQYPKPVEYSPWEREAYHQPLCLPDGCWHVSLCIRHPHNRNSPRAFPYSSPRARDCVYSKSGSLHDCLSARCFLELQPSPLPTESVELEQVGRKEGVFFGVSYNAIVKSWHLAGGPQYHILCKQNLESAFSWLTVTSYQE